MVKIALFVILSSSVAAANILEGSRVINDLRGSLNKKVSRFFRGSCQPQGMNETQLNDLEAKYFPLAAKKYSQINKCEAQKLTVLKKNFRKSQFVHQVLSDIGVKLLPLRELKKQIEILSSQIENLQKENFADEAQIARFGFFSSEDQKIRTQRMKKLEKLQSNLAPKLVAYDLLFNSIWRAKSQSMSQYLNDLIDSDLSPSEFKSKAMQASPGFIEKYWSGNFSFLDEAITPLLNESVESIDLISSQMVKTSQGLEFIPSFSTRKVLVSNMDMLYSTNNPSPKFQALVCHLNQKYVVGDSDLKKTISVAGFATGASVRIISTIMNFARIEKLIAGSQYISKATQLLAYTSSAISLETAIQASYEACHKQFEHFISTKENCSPGSSINESDFYEYRQLSKSNCAISVISGLLSTVGADALSDELSVVLSTNPDLARYLLQFNHLSRAAVKVTDQAVQFDQNKDVAQDFIDLLMIQNSKPESKR